MGVKIKYPKPEYNKLRKQNPYYEYVKNNTDITIYLDNYAMLVSNKDKTKFYIAELTDKKPEKDEFYVEIMKMLNPNFENYTDIFGNEIMFRKDEK